MARSGDEGFEQRLDRWVEAGRQFVDGVSGARPGSRGASRSSPRRSGARLNPGELGRWVENKLEWLLDEDASDDWREPWQQRPPQAEPPAQPRPRRRPLEALSRRRSDAAAPPASAQPANEGDWPGDEDFSVPRWQRQAPATAPSESWDSAEQPPQGRPLPRSSRRRAG